MQLQDELVALRLELKKLREIQDQQLQSQDLRFARFDAKLQQLSQRITTAEQEPQSIHNAAEDNVKNITVKSTADADLVVSEICDINADSVELQLESTEKQTISNKFSQSAGLLNTVLGELGSTLLGPFSSITGQIKSFYEHYQSKGLGPVFLMTVAGIITLTVGFAYLLQYSFNNWFSEVAKAIVAFIAANTILAVALIIRYKQPTMKDFASGLVGLAIILNYLCCYFIGPYLHLLPTAASFLLLLLITLLGFALSMKLETKVVSAITLIGGSVAPIMLLSAAHASLLYLPYLLLIGCCALRQSRLLQWPLLMEVATLLHIVCIEAFITYLLLPLSITDWQSLLALLSINSIFYLYGFSGIVWIAKAQNTVNSSAQILPLSKRILALPFALLAFLLVVIERLSVFSGEIFLANSVLCASLYFAFSCHKQLRALMLVFSGSFAGFAALDLISQDFLGLVLLLEGILLLWLGAKENYLSVRCEAYFLLALGLFINVQGIADALNSSANLFSDFTQYGFVLITLVFSAAALYSASLLITKLLFTSAEQGIAAERKVLIVIKESLSLSYVANLLFIAALLSYDYFLLSIPLISLLLLHLAAKDRLKLSEMLAWLLLLPLLALVAVGILDAGTASFSEQPLYAQVARIELFASLLLGYYWYKHYFANSKIIKMAYYLQLICLLLLPLIFLPKVLRNFAEYISVALWLSTFISLSLALLVRHRALIVQAKILTVLAIVLTAFSCLAEWWQGLLALMIGAGFMAILHYQYLRMKLLARIIARLQWQLSPYYFALVLAVIVHTLMNIWQANWGIVAAALCAYFAQLVSVKPVPAVLRPSYTAAYLLIFACAISPLLMHSQLRFGMNVDSLLYSLSEAATLIIVARLILARGLAIRFYRKLLPLTQLQWGWHILLTLSYLLWSYQLSKMFAAPLSAILLVTHGSWLMFISLKPQQGETIKLASGLFVFACIKVLFVDMANFAIIQKVIAFMVIGAILLSVSYFYQKARSRLAVSAESE